MTSMFSFAMSGMRHFYVGNASRDLILQTWNKKVLNPTIIALPEFIQKPAKKIAWHHTSWLPWTLLRDNFPVVTDHARQIISLFWKCSYIWTGVFKDEYCEEPYTNRLDDERLESGLRLATSQKPSVNNISVTNKQLQFSR